MATQNVQGFENKSLQGYAVKDCRFIVAVFEARFPYSFGEIRQDREACEERLQDYRNRGIPHEETLRAIKGWPDEAKATEMVRQARMLMR